jgi:hypothetical protein
MLNAPDTSQNVFGGLLGVVGTLLSEQEARIIAINKKTGKKCFPAKVTLVNISKFLNFKKRNLGNYSVTCNKSTSNIKVAFGPITPPAPLSP